MARLNNQTSTYDRVYYQRSNSTSYLLWFIILVLEVFLAFRIFLKAIGANPRAGFSNFVYGLTEPFLAPFTQLIYNPASSDHILEVTSIIAMLVYVILFGLAMILIRVVWQR